MIDTTGELRKYIDISQAEESAIQHVGEKYPWRITDYYASLMDSTDRSCPVRRQAVPSEEELDPAFGVPDPLEETANSPVPGVIRVYPDRIAVIMTGRCPVYCRHCLRKRFPRNGDQDLRGERLETVLSYIAGDRSIRDVLLTGGDPLMMEDGEIDAVLGRIRAIQHVEIIRIGTRAPCTWPQRITPAFAAMVSRHHPVWISTQFNHWKELTPEAERALALLVDHGVPVNNQSVLLRGVNDSVETMKRLVQMLVKLRIRPYYVYQAQTLSGTGHFVTTIEKGLDIIRGIRGWTTGFAVPQYVLDTPCGKIPLNPDYMTGRQGDYIEMRNFRGDVWREWNPQVS